MIAVSYQMFQLHYVNTKMAEGGILGTSEIALSIVLLRRIALSPLFCTPVLKPDVDNIFLEVKILCQLLAICIGWLVTDTENVL